MINLLPTEDARQALAEYRARRAVAGGWLAFFLLVIALVLLGTLYFIIRERRTDLAQRLQRLESQGEAREFNRLAQLWQTSQAQVDWLAGQKPARLPTELVANLNVKRSAGLRLFTFSYNHEPETPELRVTGRAGNRADLLNFIAALEADPLFLQVDSPIGNLIKSQELDFTLTLIINPQENENSV